MIYSQMKEVNHNNIRGFIGACVEPGRICYVMQYCSRGSLQVGIVQASSRLEWFWQMHVEIDTKSPKKKTTRSICDKPSSNMMSARQLTENEQPVNIFSVDPKFKGQTRLST